MSAFLRMTTVVVAAATIQCGRHASSVVDFPVQSLAVIGACQGADTVCFGHPAACAVGSDGAAYITDFDRATVFQVDSQGAIRGRFGTRGEGPGELIGPSAIAVYRDSLIVVGDVANQKIVVFSRQGGYLHQFPTHGVTQGLAFTSRGEILRTCSPSTVDSLVMVYDSHGTLVRAFGARVPNASEYWGVLDNIARIAVDDRDRARVTFAAVPILRIYDPGGGLLVERCLRLVGQCGSSSPTGELAFASVELPCERCV